MVWPSGLRSRFGGVVKGKNEELVEKRAVPIIPKTPADQNLATAQIGKAKRRPLSYA